MNTGEPETALAWGSYLPGWQGRLLLLLRRVGLGRGSAKKGLTSLWRRLSQPVPVDIEYFGLRLRVHPFDNVVENRLLFGSKIRDDGEIKFLAGALDRESVFIDVGANIGYYALRMAQAGARHTLAFEPNPVVYQRLFFNIAANQMQDRIQPLMKALGAKSDILPMKIHSRDLGGSHLADSHETTGQIIQVKVIPLLQIVQSEQLRGIDALKIDVEGLEDQVLLPFLEAAPRILWPRRLVLEHTSRGLWKRDLLRWLVDNGYREVVHNRSNALLEITT